MKIINKREKFTTEYEEKRQRVGTVYKEYMHEKYGEPKPLDKTFMYEDMKKSRVKTRRSLVTAAAVLVSVTLVMPLFVGFDNVYGDNGILHRLYETALGGLGTDKGIDDEAESTMEITDMDKIDEAVDFWEGLYIPEYVPQGYEFEKLTLRKDGVGITAKYVYHCGDEELLIDVRNSELDDVSYDSSNKGEWIEFDDRVLRVLSSGEGAEIYTEDAVIVLISSLSRDELINVAEKMKLGT